MLCSWSRVLYHFPISDKAKEVRPNKKLETNSIKRFLVDGITCSIEKINRRSSDEMISQEENTQVQMLEVYNMKMH